MMYLIHDNRNKMEKVIVGSKKKKSDIKCRFFLLLLCRYYSRLQSGDKKNQQN